jgi:hypothetical protein
MQRLEVSGAVRPLKWPLGVKWLSISGFTNCRYECVPKHYIKAMQNMTHTDLWNTNLDNDYGRKQSTRYLKRTNMKSLNKENAGE